MSGLDLGQFKSLIVTPALTSVGLGGQTAINLVTGTALKESGLEYLKQIGTGPALGVCQMEPATHDYLWTLKSMGSTADGSLGNRVLSAVNTEKYDTFAVPPASTLVWNLYYAVIMCRIKYLSVSNPLPAGDATSLALYWKKIYNSSLGAGVVDIETTVLFQAAINA